MAVIVPIRGWRYNAGSELALLIAPPYDVIDKDQQERFYALHPHNVIRLECGLSLPGDHSANNRYTRAADYFKIWRKEGVLLQDALPALYFYEQTYNLAGKRLTRRGFFSGLQLEPYGRNIFPHEDTLSAARADRMQLISTCKANFSPIFGLYADPERVVERLFAEISRVKPEYDFTGEEQQKHRLWVVTENKVIESAAKMLENRRVFIADGHHRFETALWYCLERQAAEAPSKPAPYFYVLTFLVNVYDPGLSILPTHRLVKTPAGFDLNDFLRAATEFFAVREVGEQVPLPRRRYA
ncbi:MAG: DUF1015 domain-containing protein, partial [Firmicutes bacterium]|nr:DUF1015 domain-containing protein [Bacillota bacterium]